jgi:hypothetical protein
MTTPPVIFRLLATLGACLAPATGAAPAAPAAPLDVITGGYPRAFFFRQAEEAAAAKKAEFAQWDRQFSPLMGIMGKALEEEVVGRSVTTNFFTRFKRAHPSQAVLLHMNGNSRDPRYESQRFFAGHWLYYNGATITTDVPAQPGEVVIAVSNPALFDPDGGRRGRGLQRRGRALRARRQRPARLVAMRAGGVARGGPEGEDDPRASWSVRHHAPAAFRRPGLRCRPLRTGARWQCRCAQPLAVQFCHHLSARRPGSQLRRCGRSSPR